LLKALRARGLGFRTNYASLPGRPDIVFNGARLVVFCDGDFWHGRNLSQRLRKLSRGHNAAYWVAKIQGNAARDRRNSRALREAGWTVLRVWETDINRNPHAVAAKVARRLTTMMGGFSKGLR
jgi:DNA mismatch endonuclease (patch repair protein)